jgi:hypothetical protein
MMATDPPGATFVDARKPALEAIATLVNVKRIAVDRLLLPVLPPACAIAGSGGEVI